MFTSFKRIFRCGWSNFRRQGGLTFATCFILVMAISLIAFLFFLKSFTDYAIADLEDKVNISVYFQEDASDDDMLAIKDEISKIPEVKSVDFISSEDALNAFTQKHLNDPVLIDSLYEIGDNPFLASLSIKSWQIDQYGKISDYLSGIQSDGIIEKVDYYQRQPVIDKVAAISSGIKNGGIIAGVLLSLIAVLITFNTVRLAILNQKEEIEIQRLVGASNWFIRGPFLLQGAMAGIISALVSLALFLIFTWVLSPKIEYLFVDLNLFGLLWANFWFIFGIQVAAGIVLGVGSSWLAVRRYLKV